MRHRVLVLLATLSLLPACADSEPIVPSDPSASSAGGAGGQGGEGGEGGATTTTTTTTTGEGGAAPSLCGNGVIDVGEECDDGDDDAGDGCSECVVECGGAGASKHPTTHHCYQLFASPLGWLEARAACQAWGAEAGGGDLASIRSDQELANVLLVASTEAWIGLNDRASEATYAWSDGEPFDYEAWATFEPSDDGDTGEDCVAFRTTGLWADASCGVAKAYVCERRPAGG